MDAQNAEVQTSAEHHKTEDTADIGLLGDAVDMSRIRLAIPCLGEATPSSQVSPHFGRCDSYAIITVQDGKVESVESLSNSAHTDCSSPVRRLAERGVGLMLVGGMGMRPYLSFREQGIEVRYGVSGTVEEALQSYFNNETVPMTEETLCGCHGESAHNHPH
jgi:predicted Fe-Mo cluster-binding NifX family protein